MPSFEFSDDEAETLQLAVDHALHDSQEVYAELSTDRIFDNLSDYLASMADAERTIKDLKRIKEVINADAEDV